MAQRSAVCALCTTYLNLAMHCDNSIDFRLYPVHVYRTAHAVLLFAYYLRWLYCESTNNDMNVIDVITNLVLIMNRNYAMLQESEKV